MIFHASTGLQHRIQGYLYLVTCVVFPSEPTPVPEGGFRRFVIRFCGSTYNTANHLNIFHAPDPVSPPYFIFRKLFFRNIKTKLVGNLIYASFSGFLSFFSCTARTGRKPFGLTFFRKKNSGAHFGISAVYRRG